MSSIQSHQHFQKAKMPSIQLKQFQKSYNDFYTTATTISKYIDFFSMGEQAGVQ